MGCYVLFKLLLAGLVIMSLLHHRLSTGTLARPLHANVAVLCGIIAFTLMAEINRRLGRLSVVREITGPIPDRFFRILLPIDFVLSIAICVVLHFGGGTILDAMAHASPASPASAGGAGRSAS
ncbi:hypothetical protein EON77_10470 [bacterium]|nr:MAG: hypothetical protein EON77_10470 [bacterium]